MDAPLPTSLVEDWTAVLATHRHTTLGKSCDKVFDHPVLFPLQRRRELEAMLALMQSAQVIMEIGADKGGGVYHWLAATLARHVLAIEIRGVPYAPLFVEAFPDRQIDCAATSSYAPEGVAWTRERLGGALIDVLFLDGDKAAYDQDFALYAPLVRPGGLVLMHDVNPTPPTPIRAVFDALGQAYRTEEIRDVSEGQEALDRLARGEPATTAHEQWLRYWNVTSCGVGVVHV